VASVAFAASLARRLEGQRQGHNWRFPCPLGCGYTLSICDGEDGQLLAYCFGGCGYDEVLSALVEYGLFDDDDDALCRDLSRSVRPGTADDIARSRSACWIYHHLAPAAGTLAATYLRSRHIAIAAPSVLRFGNCPHRLGGMFPAMAAPVVDVNGAQTGVHMTYLRADGTGKADFPNRDFQRECRGVVRGGSIRLIPHDPNRELIIAEGIETALSASEIFGLPAWSAVSAGGLKTLELPPAVRRIVIAADRDVSGTGQRNALAAYHRWSAEGRSVRIVIPTSLGDFNDALTGRG
jgi:hypothetical protein